MYKVDDIIKTKSIDQIKSEFAGHFRNISDTKILIQNPITWMVDTASNFWGKEWKISKIDNNDIEVPYQVENDIWVPEILIDNTVSRVSKKESISDSRASQTKYGPIFKVIINLEQELFGSSIIKDTNKTRLSLLTINNLKYIENMLATKYSSFTPTFSKNKKEKFILNIHNFIKQNLVSCTD